MKEKSWAMVALLLAPWLGGCSLTHSEPPTSLVTPDAGQQLDLEGKASPEVIVASPPSVEAKDDAEVRMQRCHGELQALKKVDGKRYAERKVEFDRLIAGAAMYAGVRGAVQSRTQEAVDALYRYRADKLCADIGQDVLNGLARTGSAHTSG
ncbi:hypothetical protein FOT43_22580 [Serratia marcescens]|uniref:hypothetical protein n=1 Tax=Serratia marcescens TaxID=615 RepID=UPI00117DBEFD|nr:hypothetical protein [Serratia marcescens]TSB25745.1 hypothetical protein FOT43_22580 [Serratia marcescens]TXE43918.1 hypothetical protein FOT60_12570 [Serratia marcescens]